MSEPEPIREVIADVMITFFDAVRDDPEMTDYQKIYWLHVTAKDYFEKLEEMEPQLTAALAEIETFKIMEEELGRLLDYERVVFDSLLKERDTALAEVERLRAIEKAALALPEPDTEDDAGDPWCPWCRANDPAEEYEHYPSCAWLALQNALYPEDAALAATEPDDEEDEQ